MKSFLFMMRMCAVLGMVALVGVAQADQTTPTFTDTSTKNGGGESTFGCFDGTSDADSARFICGTGYKGIGKFELTGSTADALKAGVSAGLFAAVGVNLARFDAVQTNKSSTVLQGWDPLNWLWRFGVVIDPSFGSGTSKTAATSSTSGGQTSSAAMLTLDGGFGLHAEIPYSAFNFLPTKIRPTQSVGVGLIMGWSYSGSKTDVYNGKPWIGLSLGQYF